MKEENTSLFAVESIFSYPHLRLTRRLRIAKKNFEPVSAQPPTVQGHIFQPHREPPHQTIMLESTIRKRKRHLCITM
jgi:hypothetical protein